jgi:hypothetical protein
VQSFDDDVDATAPSVIKKLTRNKKVNGLIILMYMSTHNCISDDHLIFLLYVVLMGDAFQYKHELIGRFTIIFEYSIQ